MRVCLEELRVNGAKWPLDIELELDECDLKVQVHIPELQTTVEAVANLKVEILKELAKRVSSRK